MAPLDMVHPLRRGQVQEIEQGFRALAIIAEEALGPDLVDAVVAQGQLADQRSGQDHVVEQKVIDRFPDRSHNRRVDVAGRGVIDDAGQAAQGLAFHLVERKAQFLIADVNLAGLLAGDRADEQHQRHDDDEKDRD